MKKNIVLAALLGFAGVAAAAPNLIQNGSFESTAITNSWTVVNSLDSWTLGRGGVEVRDNVAGSAFRGSNYVELDAHANSWISQTFSAVAGYTYKLRFAYAPRDIPSFNGNNIGEGDSNLINVLVSQGTSTLVDSNVTGFNNEPGDVNVWKIKTYFFTALADGEATLKFSAAGASDSYGGALDAVRLTVSAVPEPETYAMFLAGLGMMAGVARRRKIRS